MLIVIDGIDGSGKTTQTEILKRNLKKEKKEVVTLDFPQYKQFFGNMVKLFLNGEFGSVDQVNPYLASCLYAFDRWQSREKLIDWVHQKKIIILNRYVTSSLVHQAIKVPTSKRKAYMKWLEHLEYTIFGLPKPDIVLYLYLPANLSYALITKRGGEKDQHEADINHLKKAAKQGAFLAKSRKNWHFIQCNKGDIILSKEEISNKIWDVVLKALSHRC